MVMAVLRAVPGGERHERDEEKNERNHGVKRLSVIRSKFRYPHPAIRNHQVPPSDLISAMLVTKRCPLSCAEARSVASAVRWASTTSR